MRKSLERTIIGPYGDIAKEQIYQEHDGESITTAEKDELDTVLNWHLNEITEARVQKKEGKKNLTRAKRFQKEIFDIQKRKQEVVRWLEGERQRFNDPKYRPEKPQNSRDVSYENGEYIVIVDGQKTMVTIGEIITDYELGIEYYLDPGSVPKSICKKYAFEKTKRTLDSLLQQQIILDELSRGGIEAGGPIASKKKVIEQSIGHGEEGFVAEIMVSNFLEKLSIDLDADFILVRADVYEDVAHKIDFIIRRKSHDRGVKVESQEGDTGDNVKTSVGIQFTISQSRLSLGKKKKQLMVMKEKIGEEIELDDIVLVNIPLRGLREIFLQWKAANCPSGGPDKLWDVEIKQAIAEGILHGIMAPGEITNLKSKIK